MPRTIFLAFTFCLALAGQAPTNPDGRDEAMAILDKAIKAHGGEQNLKRFQTWSVKSKGNSYLNGQASPFSAERFVRLPNQSRVVVNFVEGNAKKTQIRILNGDRGWKKDENGPATEMKEFLLAAEKLDLYADRLERLICLKEREFKLRPLPEGKVGDQRVIGLRVMHEKLPEFRLLFDSKTGLLVKTEHQYNERKDKKTTSEVFYSDYKQIEGIQLPTRVIVNIDGEKYLNEELSDYQRHDKLDDQLFAKP